MKNHKKLFALALSTLLLGSSLSLLASCGEKKSAFGSEYVESALGATIVFDNYNKGYIAEKDTQYTLEFKKGKSADVVATAYTVKLDNPTGYTARGKVDIDATKTEVDLESIAHWDKDTKTLTAKAEGTVTLELVSSSGKVLETVSVDIAPAYVENPLNQYKVPGTSASDRGNATMGGTHDPSLIEVEEEDGKKAYYMFSTGWADGNEIRKSYDLVHWKYLGKTTNGNQKDLEPIYEWLYNGNTSLKGRSSWWAPDIVPAYGGGYWLYTCTVDGTDGVSIDGGTYATACITLFYSDTLEPESFTYKGVLMQSCIDQAYAALDVNSIDPQIIYTPDGKMYMAYGSFGTGNYILELNPETGLRKDNFYKDDEYLSWQKVREYSDQAIEDFNNFKYTVDDEDGERIAWESEFYGKNISRGSMEAPVIARHDNVKIYDDEGNVTETVPVYYYSMHSYDPLDAGYNMRGGRSADVTGVYRSVNGNTSENYGSNHTGNQYMSSIVWDEWEEGDGTKVEYCLDCWLPGHNDLFTTDNGKSIAAYITRSQSFSEWAGEVLGAGPFTVQTHQYYLNSKGDICINPNRYGGETHRSVSKEELLAFTKDNRFKLIELVGRNGSNYTHSVAVQLNADGTISGAKTGTWSMFGDNFIKIQIPGSDTYYGVVEPTWLDDQDCFGFTITAMGQSRGYALFMNNVSTEKK